MTSEQEGQKYIRECAAFPYGLWLHEQAIPELLSRDLITESDTWPGDYQAIYDPSDDDERDRVGDEIEDVAMRYDRWLSK